MKELREMWKDTLWCWNESKSGVILDIICMTAALTALLLALEMYGR